MSLIASAHWHQLQAVQQQLIDILFFLGGPVSPLYVCEFSGSGSMGLCVHGPLGAKIRFPGRILIIQIS